MTDPTEQAHDKEIDLPQKITIRKSHLHFPNQKKRNDSFPHLFFISSKTHHKQYDLIFGAETLYQARKNQQHFVSGYLLKIQQVDINLIHLPPLMQTNQMTAPFAHKMTLQFQKNPKLIPILAQKKKDKFELIQGLHPYHFAKNNQLKHIPVIILPSIENTHKKYETLSKTDLIHFLGNNHFVFNPEGNTYYRDLKQTLLSHSKSPTLKQRPLWQREIQQAITDGIEDAIKQIISEKDLKLFTLVEKQIFSHLQTLIEHHAYQFSSDTFEVASLDNHAIHEEIRNLLIKKIDLLLGQRTISTATKKKNESTRSIKNFLETLKHQLLQDEALDIIESAISQQLFELREKHKTTIVHLERYTHVFKKALSSKQIIAQLKLSETICKRYIKFKLTEPLFNNSEYAYPFLHPSPSYKNLLNYNEQKYEKTELLSENSPFQEIKFIYQLPNDHFIPVSIHISKYGLLTYKVDQFENYCPGEKTIGAYDKLTFKYQCEQNLCQLIKDNLSLNKNYDLNKDYYNYLSTFIFTLFYIEGMRNPGSFITHLATLEQLLRSNQPKKFIQALNNNTFTMTAKGATAMGRSLHEQYQTISSPESISDHFYRFYNTHHEMMHSEISAIKNSTELEELSHCFYGPNSLD